jgi:hypothetical protein
MPPDVRPGQVLSLLDKVEASGGRIHAGELARQLEEDLAVFPSVLEATEMLGLVRNEGGEICLTDEGKTRPKSRQGMAEILNASLAGVEPFGTAIELAKRGKPIRASDVPSALKRKGISYHLDQQTNVSTVTSVLVAWAVFPGLLRYEGSGKFEES